MALPGSSLVAQNADAALVLLVFAALVIIFVVYKWYTLSVKSDAKAKAKAQAYSNPLFRGTLPMSFLGSEHAGAGGDIDRATTVHNLRAVTPKGHTPEMRRDASGALVHTGRFLPATGADILSTLTGGGGAAPPPTTGACPAPSDPIAELELRASASLAGKRYTDAELSAIMQGK